MVSVGRTAEEKLKRSLFGDDQGILHLWWSIFFVFHWQYLVAAGKLLFTLNELQIYHFWINEF